MALFLSMIVHTFYFLNFLHFQLSGEAVKEKRKGCKGRPNKKDHKGSDLILSSKLEMREGRILTSTSQERATSSGFIYSVRTCGACALCPVTCPQTQIQECKVNLSRLLGYTFFSPLFNSLQRPWA